tara:strand:+ start:14357 stop:14749 length:393 start_codon:yes stop_codon:yes gene_type:complete
VNLDADAVTRAIKRVGAKCGDDEQFVQATKFWDGSLRLGIGDTCVVFRFDSGKLQSAYEGDDDYSDASGSFGLNASIEAWNQLLSQTPNDEQLTVTGWAGDVIRTGDRDTYWRYYPALRRLIELAGEELR